MTDTQKRQWETEEVVVAGAVGFGVGCLTMAFYAKHIMRKIEEINTRSAQRRDALFDHAMKIAGKYASKEELDALLDHAKVNLIAAGEDGREIIGYGPEEETPDH